MLTRASAFCLIATIQVKFMPQRLIIVRHPSIPGNDEGRFIGTSDIRLGEQEEKEALGLSENLISKYSFQAIFSSPLQRCRRTAEIAAEKAGSPVQIINALREIDFGEWENCNFQEVSKAHPEAVQQWLENGSNFQFPGGEKISAFHERVKQATEAILRSEGESLLTVTHGGVMRTMLCHLLRVPFTASLAFKVQPAAVAEIEIHDGMGVLKELNNSNVPAYSDKV